MSKLVVILLAFMCLATTLSRAQINETQELVSIAVLVDSNENWTMDSLLTREIQQAFDSSPLESPYFGYTTKPHWFRLILPVAYDDNEVSIIINYPSQTRFTLCLTACLSVLR